MACFQTIWKNTKNTLIIVIILMIMIMIMIIILQLPYSPLFSRDLNFAKIFSAHFASL